MAVEIDEFHHVLETVVNGLSIILNSILLYLIKFHSNFGVKLYQYLLTVDVALDLGLGIVAMLCQPIALNADGILTMYSNGFFSNRSALLDSVLLTLFFFFVHTNLIWIPMQFIFRYRMFCKDDHGLSRATIAIITVAAIYSLFALLVFYSVINVREEYQPTGQYVLDLYEWTNNTKNFLMGATANDLSLILWLVVWNFSGFGSICIVIWCEMGIVKYLRELGTPTHENTARMHKEFHRALMAMAICPLVTITVPVIYFILSFTTRLRTRYVSVIMTSGLSCITLFNPITTILIFRCFREVIFRTLSCNIFSTSMTKVIKVFETTQVTSSFSLAPDRTRISNSTPMDNDTLVEAFKYLNYSHLATNCQEHVCAGHYPTVMFDKELSPEEYKEWVIRNGYLEHIPLESQVVGEQSAHDERICYQLIAETIHRESDSPPINITTSVFLARLELSHENWPVFQHFVRLLTDPFIYINNLELVPQIDVLNLLAGAIKSDRNRLQ
ncbi:serpentine type 7TM GPCR chemoreceptor srd domain-containing protein [Ditylenchus destructor]|nr:serpentine type 7TM GPCR chemoreceptor srd domain-containing protein [Ditylenchus destructor]